VGGKRNLSEHPHGTRCHSIGSRGVPLLLNSPVCLTAMLLPQRLCSSQGASTVWTWQRWKGPTPWRTPGRGLSPAAASQLGTEKGAKRWSQAMTKMARPGASGSSGSTTEACLRLASHAHKRLEAPWGNHDARLSAALRGSGPICKSCQSRPQRGAQGQLDATPRGCLRPGASPTVCRRPAFFFGVVASIALPEMTQPAGIRRRISPPAE